MKCGIRVASYSQVRRHGRSTQRGSALLEMLIGIVLVFGALGIVGLQTVSFQKTTPHLTNQVRLNQASEEIAARLAASRISTPQSGWALIGPTQLQLVTRPPDRIDGNVVAVQYTANFRVFLDGLVEVVVYLKAGKGQSTVGVAHYRRV